MSKKKKKIAEKNWPNTYLIGLYWHKVIPFTQSSFVKKKASLVLRDKKDKF